MTNLDNNDRWKQLVGMVLKARKDDRGTTARLRYGLNDISELRAYGDVLPYATGKHDEVPLLRAAGLIALHPNIPQIPAEGKTRPPGASFRQFSFALARGRGETGLIDPGSPDPIALRLAQLPDQDLNTAALTLNRILSIGDSLGVPVDYFALTRLLLRWGNGLTEKSTEVRRAPLRDYYRYQPKDPAQTQAKEDK